MAPRNKRRKFEKYAKVLFINGKWSIECPVCHHRTPTPDWAIDHHHIDSIFVCERCRKQTLIPAGAIKEGMANEIFSTMESMGDKKPDG